jgi:hypothetical protein
VESHYALDIEDRHDQSCILGFMFLGVVFLWGITHGVSQMHGPNKLLIIVTAIAGAILAVIVTVPYWVIFKKAGFSPALSVLTLLPLVNLILLYFIAFSDWKNASPRKS